MKISMIHRIEQLMNVHVADTRLIQSLWSGYGGLYKLTLSDGPLDSIIVKRINSSEIYAHPKGWKTNIGHQRKIKSYQVEKAFYINHASFLHSKIVLPQLLDWFELENETFLILTDLTLQQHYPAKNITMNGIYSVLNWLANFHASFMFKVAPELWSVGSYWHLATRKEEWNSMPSDSLKDNAFLIDERLSNSEFQTIIHGDAKWANFCFSKDQKEAAGLDFQYVGKGCGIKDVVYFLTSVFDNEQLLIHADKMVDQYFYFFEIATRGKLDLNLFKKIEIEWRAMYPFAWADFTRFLKGWLPNHHKLTGYALQQTDLAIQLL